MKLVLDTNVVIDWLVFDAPFLAAFRSSVLDGRTTIVTHMPALTELQRVLGYPELRLTAERQASVLTRYEAQTSMLPMSSDSLPDRFPLCRDSDDDHFLALAWYAKADALVSRDHAVLKLAKRARKFGVSILTVPELVERVGLLGSSGGPGGGGSGGRGLGDGSPQSPGG